MRRGGGGRKRGFIGLGSWRFRALEVKMVGCSAAENRRRDCMDWIGLDWDRLAWIQLEMELDGINQHGVSKD